MEKEFWLVVGLGNPGSQYQHTRHNVGFMVVDSLCEQHESFAWQSSQRFSGMHATGKLASKAVVLSKPQTYMNLSGRSVQALAQFYRIPVDRVIVIHDDVDLELGRLKIKSGGGDGGHKGIQSIAQQMGSSQFFRIRVGIGRPSYSGQMTNFVLGSFGEDELPLVKDQIHKAGQAVGSLLSRGLKETMNRFNRRILNKDTKSNKPKESETKGLALTEEKS